VIERAGEVRAVFTRAGEHWYVASIIDGGHRHARGVVVVRAPESESPDVLYPACAPESSTGSALRRDEAPGMRRLASRGADMPHHRACGAEGRVRLLCGKFLECEDFWA